MHKRDGKQKKATAPLYGANALRRPMHSNSDYILILYQPRVGALNFLDIPGYAWPDFFKYIPVNVDDKCLQSRLTGIYFLKLWRIQESKKLDACPRVHLN